MLGPEILARSLSATQIADKFSNTWQYHSQSDSHSKIACWAVLFDLLHHCPLLLAHVEAKKVGFGINHAMGDFRTGREKNLDLVLCTPGTDDGRSSETFAGQVKAYSVVLTATERASLAELPSLARVPVGSVHVAIEAKATMTEHVKALPRLYDELNSSHLAIHGSADFAVAAGFAIVNLAETFVSTGRNKADLSSHEVEITRHKQPMAAQRTIEKLREIPRRTQLGEVGFDALGILVIKMANDGSPVTVVNGPPSPGPRDVLNYEQMIHRVASLYATKFGNV